MSGLARLFTTLGGLGAMGWIINVVFDRREARRGFNLLRPRSIRDVQRPGDFVILAQPFFRAFAVGGSVLAAAAWLAVAVGVD